MIQSITLTRADNGWVLEAADHQWQQSPTSGPVLNTKRITLVIPQDVGPTEVIADVLNNERPFWNT